MARYECTTQKQLDAVFKKAGRDDLIICLGNGTFDLRAYDSSTVRAYGSATVHASGSSTVRASDSATVHAYGSSTVHAYDSSTVHAYGSATVHASGSSTVRAYGSATVRAYGSATVRAGKYVAVTVDKRTGASPKVDGGVLIEVPPITTAEEWLALYGVEVTDGLATLYKAVDDDYATEQSRNIGIFYRPGEQPSAPDWDGGRAECGRGLHFCPTPHYARRFNTRATRFVACPVRVSDIVVHSPARHPDKIKAPRVAGPIYEVDEDGNRLDTITDMIATVPEGDAE